LQKTLTKAKGDGDILKMSSIQDIEKIKDEITERYKVEMSAKNQEMMRLEKMYTERIDTL
jgi:hypothetical protein